MKEGQMTIIVMVEIPKGSRNKYEYDKEKKRLKFDRMLFSAEKVVSIKPLVIKNAVELAVAPIN